MKPSSIDLQPSLVQLLWYSLRRRWRLALIGICLSAGLALYLGNRMSTTRWEIRASLLYQPITIREEHQILYRSPNFPSMQEMIELPALIEAALLEKGLYIPPAVIANNLEISVPRDSEMLVLSLIWSDPQSGVGMLGTLMEQAIVYQQASRTKQLNASLTKLNRHLDEVIQDTQVQEQVLSDLLRDTDYPEDPLEAEQELKDDLKKLEEKIALATRQKEIQQTLLQNYDELIQGIQKGPGTSEMEALRDQMLKRISIRGYLEDLKQDEYKLKNLEAEYSDAAPLVKKGIIAANDVEKLRRELDRLRDKVHRTKEDIRLIENLFEQDPSLHSPLEITPNFTPGKMDVHRKQGLQLQVTGFEKEIQVLHLRREKKQTELDGVEQLIAKHAAFFRRLEHLRDEKEHLKKQLAALEAYTEFEPELAIMTPPRVSQLLGTTQMKFTVASGVGLIGLVLLGLMGPELWRMARSLRGVAWHEGVPVLADYAHPPWERQGLRPLTDPDRAGQTRQLALRLSQRLSEPGSVLLLTPLDPNTRIEELAGELGEYLACHEEKVLILDMSLDDHGFAMLIAQRAVSEHVTIFQANGERPPSSVIAGQSREQRRLRSAPALSDPEQVALFDELNGHDAKDVSSVTPPSSNAFKQTSGSMILFNQLQLGFLTYLHQTGQSARELVFTTQVEQVDYLPAGNVRRMIGATALQRMRKVLADLRQAYTFIIILGPAHAEPVDSETLSTFAAGVVAVGPPALTQPAKTATRLRDLGKLEAPLLGVVTYPVRPLFPAFLSESRAGRLSTVSLGKPGSFPPVAVSQLR